MTPKEKNEILKKYKEWVNDTLVPSHLRALKKLESLNAFKTNPLVLRYLANFFNGDESPESIAKILIYPRILGTSFVTIFGIQIQSFITKVLPAYGSGIQGFDIEYIDGTDGRKKYTQLKSGPNAINKDDIKTISDHFKNLQNIARINKMDVRSDDLKFALIYGEKSEFNAFIKTLAKSYDVLSGEEFWTSFTGDPDFFKDLIAATGEVAKSVNMKAEVDDIVAKLSDQIKIKYFS